MTIYVFCIRARDGGEPFRHGSYADRAKAVERVKRWNEWEIWSRRDRGECADPNNPAFDRRGMAFVREEES